MILWENIEALQTLIQEVKISPYSDFYKTKYSDLPDSFSGSIEEIPFLTREEIVEMSADSRLYIPKQEVSFVGFTSGTTTGRPLVSYFSEVEDYFFEPSLGVEVDRLLITYPPLNKNFGASFIQQCRQAKRKVTPVFADYQNLANSAVIAAQTQCDAIYATPTLAIELGTYISRYYDSNKIKLVAVSSEVLTETKFLQLQSLYPNALIANLYASSEVGQFILYPCVEEMEKRVTQAFHFLEKALLALEIIEGELVVTCAQNAAFPLIRYKTGDSFEVERGVCSCISTTPRLMLHGRDGVDVVRVHGFEVRVGDVDAFFATLPHSLKTYQLHFYNDTENSKAIKLVIEIVSKNKEADVFLQTIIKDTFMSDFLFASGVTAADMITKGLFNEIVVEIVEEVSLQTQKQRTLVSHIV